MTQPVPEPLDHRTFIDRTLRASRFIGCDFGEVVIRGSEIAGMELDSPWLFEGDAGLVVNGVDVAPFVDGELNRRFPGRELRTAGDPAGLRDAWAAVERTWAATLARALAMPADTLDTSVAGEWSLIQTLRHLVMATDTWLGKAILRHPQPYHPVGLPNDGGDSAAYDPAVFSNAAPTFDDVLAARVERVAMVREFIGGVTDDELATHRPNPHAPEHDETVLSCLRTILEEEWEHHRYAVRDLDALAAA